ncbi:MAG: AzlC family ABC transporter permease [Clostridia bacterium]|nr:AzlC family ABC transporter permease [Clostridia bacterium]
MGYTFRKGLIDGLPVCIGYLSVSFAFGIFAVGSGFGIAEALMISMFNVTSAGQLAAVPIIASGGMMAELAMSQLVINLRYALMSVSLSQRLDRTVRLRDRFLIAFVNTDEVFAIASSQRELVGRRYLYGLILTPYLGWSLGTLLGAIAGDILPTIVTAALGIAIYGMFIAIVTPVARADRATAACVLIAAVLSCLFRYVPALSAVPSGFVIIICAVIAAGVMAVVAPVKISSEEVPADA